VAWTNAPFAITPTLVRQITLELPPLLDLHFIPDQRFALLSRHKSLAPDC
jgi:hypothetical protein